MGLELVSVVTVLLGSGTPHDMDDVECLLELHGLPPTTSRTGHGWPRVQIQAAVQLAELKWH